MDKEYVLFTIRERIAELKHRYNMHCNMKDEFGKEFNRDVSAVYRSNVKRDLRLCMLVEELIVGTPGKLTVLSDEATEGLEKLMEPYERHRRMKG